MQYTLFMETCTILCLFAAMNDAVVPNIKIGAIFHIGDQQLEKAFDTAVNDLNADFNNNFNFIAIKKTNANFDSFKTASIVCDLLEDGVAAIFGPKQYPARDIVSSITKRFNVPHIEYSFRQTDSRRQTTSSINVYPSSKIYEKVIAETVKRMNWNSYTFIYQTTNALSRVQEALQNQAVQNCPITVRELQPFDRIQLFKTRKEQDNVYECLVKEIRLSSQYSLLLDIESDNISKLFQIMGSMDLMGDYFMCFLINLDLPVAAMKQFISKNTVANITWLQFISDEDSKEPIEAALLYDAVFALGGALNSVFRNQKGSDDPKILLPRPLLCNGAIKYEAGLNITKAFYEGSPYVMEADSDLEGRQIEDKRYHGYCIDLISKIEEYLKIKCEFYFAPHNEYGRLDSQTHQWNGLVRQLLDHKADFAICDLTITSERQSAVDFTAPFMNLGISILFKKPNKEPAKLFAFMDPLSTEVWMYMATAYLIVSLMLFFQARIAPGEWINPHPCNPNPEELENNFTLMNSMWLTMGSLMQQGSDILPRTPSIRMVAGIWWFFVLIMVSSYTANLAAFLTAVKMEDSINDVEDLAKQTKISYGAVKNGATYSFFKNSNTSLYQRLFNNMVDAKPTVFTRDNDEGVERVIKGKRKYAFFMESTTIEYQVERRCELQMVGTLLDNKGYGIAMPHNSPYRTMISTAILHLQEKGDLQDLKKKWWSEKGGGQCNDSSEPVNSNELGMPHVGGVFIVLILGCFISTLIAVIEFLWNIRKVAVEEKVTLFDAFIKEIKFIINIWAVTKPVRVECSSKSLSSKNRGSSKSSSMNPSYASSLSIINVTNATNMNQINM
ncbi:glutamate receptor ionotropic, kainate 2-like isoform X2 [Phymastichus coffea]|uniref:glutamate receptor ionotropic, kainate 2-like isoform X2 n=1 Tax=Phymastichus coffea TaxID=108790 RepID=UPI00273C1388|nr:glutamate receptor ionotropic, kainate 2-like isoform X2 [Phymastichus coffea]